MASSFFKYAKKYEKLWGRLSHEPQSINGERFYGVRDKKILILCNNNEFALESVFDIEPDTVIELKRAVRNNRTEME